MPFDNIRFTRWLVDFERELKECGMPEAQALRYRGEYNKEALAYFVQGVSPSDAAVKELLG